MRDGHLPAQRAQLLFKTGQSAMLLDDLNNADYYATRMQILTGSASALGGVTPPVDPKSRTGEYRLGSIYSISATSEHKEEAWQFIRFMLEREKMEQQREWKEYEHIPFESLYSLTPKLETVVKPSFIPNSIAARIQKMISHEIMEVVEGRKSLDEALLYLETEGQGSIDAEYLNLQSEQEQEQGTN